MTDHRPPHVLPVRVYFEDTDAGGVVYHANYLNYAERARTEMMRLGSYDHARMVRELNHVFVVRRCDMDFRAPAVLDDLIQVETMMTGLKGASMALRQDITRDGQLLVGINITLACVNMETMRPARFPAEVMAALKEFEGAEAA
ncbi:tol-pal system-associated acyl-CoA thioesterase [Aestuariispira insulae]|uniref:Acyl-CoA thioester hydrolase n=1 Tax=Aestuariispira insulae TaxID=1461337 RepID=A0A3D9HLL6_9PROT|nr:tol-pal system-associated acyl-CoA thioesterase [Aestuariispira insulae]RED49786.1 acyl-CoA thioester hydrolase [Aestuariispira insulae]